VRLLAQGGYKNIYAEFGPFHAEGSGASSLAFNSPSEERWRRLSLIYANLGLGRR